MLERSFTICTIKPTVFGFLISNLNLTNMLSNARIFSSFSVDNIIEAKRFYTEVLALDACIGEMGVLEIKTGGTVVAIAYPKENHTPATFTVLNFVVEDVEKTVDELTGKGVVFEQYDQPHLKTDEKGISWGNGGPTIAWFKDTAGNILSVLQEKS